MPTVGVSLVGAATAEHMQTIQPSEGVALEEEGRSLPLRESQRACLFLNAEYETYVYVYVSVCVRQADTRVAKRSK